MDHEKEMVFTHVQIFSAFVSVVKATTTNAYENTSL